MARAQSSGTRTEKVDVVIVGAGGGLAAAVAAAEKGAKVLVIEGRKKAGGNITMARGFLAADSPVQKRLKIMARKEDLFNTSMSYAHWQVDPLIIKAVIDKSGDTVGWLEEMGVVFGDVPHSYFNQFPRIYHIPDGHGPRLVKALLGRCGDLGVQILYGTKATKVLTDKKGGVVGVEAETNGSAIRAEAKSVVIGTGGYSGNRELLKKHYAHYTENIRLYGLPNMGDGLRMATEAGAGTEGLGTILHMGPFFEGSLYVHQISQEGSMIWVNNAGQRFANEAHEVPSETANALNRQPGKVCYALFDESIKRSFMEEGLVRAVDSHYPIGMKMTQLDEYLRKEVENGKAVISMSWEEIAVWIGAQCDILKSAISEYNGYCVRRQDGTFYKDPKFLRPLQTPPFYALRCCQAFHGTIGGIRINHRMEVLNDSGFSIPGLFALGNDTGGWFHDTYPYHLTGTALSFALNSGRIAGESAADHAKGREATGKGGFLH